MSIPNLISTAVERAPRRQPSQRVPRPVDGEPGLVLVDVTWGLIGPMALGGGVRTVGELEVIDHIVAGLPLVDTRQPDYFEAGTIPTAVNIPHQDVIERLAEFDPRRATAVFCNGPQCTATRQAVEDLLAAGYPADALLYYRGGIHDWVTLGLPLETP